MNTAELLTSIDKRLESLEELQTDRIEVMHKAITMQQAAFEALSLQHLGCATRTDERLKRIEEDKKETKITWLKKLGIIVGFIVLAISGTGSAIYSVAITNEAIRGIRDDVAEIKIDVNSLESKTEKTMRDIALMEGKNRE